MLSILYFICWAVGKIIFKKKKKLNLSLMNLPLVFFLIYPSILNEVLKTVSFKRIEGTDRLYENLDLIRDGEEHRKILRFFTYPGFVVWGLGIPFLSYLIVQNNKKIQGLFPEIFLTKNYRNKYKQGDAFMQFRLLTVYCLVAFT